MGQLSIFLTLSSSGSLPSGVHFCPKMITSGLQICVLDGEKVAPECLTRCMILCTSIACSQMNLRIPGFSGCVSGLPLTSRYALAGPLIGRSSMIYVSHQGFHLGG